jgi:hypothetical protein
MHMADINSQFPTSANLNNSNHNLDPLEIDRLHIRWILSKNRNSSKSLSQNELAILVAENRISPEEATKDSGLNEETILKLIKDLRTSKTLINSQPANSKTLAQLFLYALRQVTLKNLILVDKYCTEAEWRNKDPFVKDRLYKIFAYLYFGIKEEDLKKSLHKLI